jgi:hypothetical protein
LGKTPNSAPYDRNQDFKIRNKADPPYQYKPSFEDCLELTVPCELKCPAFPGSTGLDLKKERQKFLRKKRNELQKKLKTIESTIKKVKDKEKNAQAINTVEVIRSKEEAIEKLYRWTTKAARDKSIGNSPGGVYAHLRKGSMDKVFQALKESTGFNRTSFLFDFGCGLNIPALHAVTKYCSWAVGIEIHDALVQGGVEMALEYLEDPFCRNHRHAIILGDGLDLKPVRYGTHLYMFDLVFSPDTYLEAFKWATKSSFSYIVTFKLARYPSLLNEIQKIIDVEVIETVGNLSMAVSGEQCTAKILKINRKQAVDRAVTHGSGGRAKNIDSWEVVAPFVNTDNPKDTIACYQKLQEDLAVTSTDKSTRRTVYENE